MNFPNTAHTFLPSFLHSFIHSFIQSVLPTEKNSWLVYSLFVILCKTHFCAEHAVSFDQGFYRWRGRITVQGLTHSQRQKIILRRDDLDIRTLSRWRKWRPILKCLIINFRHYHPFIYTRLFCLETLSADRVLLLYLSYILSCHYLKKLNLHAWFFLLTINMHLYCCNRKNTQHNIK